MSHEELPENQHYDAENKVFKEVLNKYFNGEIPNEKSRKDALTLIYNTQMFNQKTDDDIEYESYNYGGY